MKTRWRILNRKSPDPSSPSRPGEAASTHRSGEPYSPHRSGEGDTSAAASDGGGGGDKGKHWRNRSPSSGEDTPVRPKRRRKKVKRRFSDPVRICVVDVGEGSALVQEEQKLAVNSAGSGWLAGWLRERKAAERLAVSAGTSQPNRASNRPNLQEAGEVSSGSPPGKKEGKRAVSKTGKNKQVWVPVLDLLASRRYCPSAQEHVNDSSDEKETSSGMMVEKTKPSSEDLCKIAQDVDAGEGGHSDKSLGLRASHSSSQWVEAHEKGSLDEEETSSGLKAEMKPKTSSEDHRKISEGEDDDEDENVHSNKSLSSTVDLSEIAQHEEEQHSEKVGRHAIKDHRQEQGEARIHAQLLDLDNDTIVESIVDCIRHLKYVGPKDSCAVEEPQHVLFERLALYRIRGYELSVGRNLDKLDDASLAQCYPPDILCEEGYFEHYEESLEWYFDPELCEYTGFDDYQRLVVRNDGHYYDWESFSSARNRLEIDLEYVQYCDALEKEIKWVEDYMLDRTIPWEKVENVAYLQALKNGADFPNVSPSLLLTGFRAHIWSIEFDFSSYGLDRLYFEIWKRVTKQKMDFTKALLEIYEEKMFPSCTSHIELDMKSPVRCWTMGDKYDAYVACIGDSVSDDEALMIKEAVIKMNPKRKDYVDYARKKLEIAKDIGLIKEVGPVFPIHF